MAGNWAEAGRGAMRGVFSGECFAVGGVGLHWRRWQWGRVMLSIQLESMLLDGASASQKRLTN